MNAYINFMRLHSEILAAGGVIGKNKDITEFIGFWQEGSRDGPKLPWKGSHPLPCHILWWRKNSPSSAPASTTTWLFLVTCYQAICTTYPDLVAVTTQLSLLYNFHKAAGAGYCRAYLGNLLPYNLCSSPGPLNPSFTGPQLLLTMAI